MQSLPVYHRIRILLKYLHVVSSGIWVGTGACILLLLYLDSQTVRGDELFAFNRAIVCIDDYLLIPGATLCIVSGVTICIIEDFEMFSCRWVLRKCAGSIAALTIGIFFMAPWMKLLKEIVDSERILSLSNLDYLDIWRADVILSVIQLVVLLYIIYMSIKRPCLNFQNCKQCRESRG